MIAGMRQFLVYTLAVCLVAAALWLALFYLSWPEQDRNQAEPKPQGQAEGGLAGPDDPSLPEAGGWSTRPSPR